MAVHYERVGAASVLTIDRPERRNAVDRETAEALYAGFRRFVGDDEARVLVVTGAGGEAFCGGADLKAMNIPTGVTPPSDGTVTQEGPMGFTRAHSPKPTIAAIDGWCVAGGLEIACWCDIRVASENSNFGCLERRWGVPLIDGGTQRLPHIVGLGRALDLILTGRPIDAVEAERIGLVQRVVPKGKALESALEIAEQIAGFPQGCVNVDRQALYEGLGKPLSEGLVIEATLGRTVLKEAARGAARFAGGEGRHAGFGS